MRKCLRGCYPLITLGVVLSVGLFSLPEAAYGQFCPVDPAAEMRDIAQQMEQLQSSMNNLQKTDDVSVRDVKALKEDPGDQFFLMTEVEQVVTQIDREALALFARALEVNECCFRAGKFTVWIEVEEILLVIKRTYIQIIKIESKIIKSLRKIKVKIAKAGIMSNCCDCDPPFGCASGPGIAARHCPIACDPQLGTFVPNAMCSFATGNCMPGD